MPQNIDMSKIGLRPREMSVLRYASWARTQVSNGHYLCSDGQRRAAERMIERGFLTRVKHQFSPPKPDWIVVIITEKNMKALRKAEAAWRPSRKAS